MPDDTTRPGIIIVGGGAAGLATAIFTRRLNPLIPVQVLDGASRLGAKILVSGGSRCNVTNAVVTERDYWGGKRTIVRRVLARLSVAGTIAFFREIGVPLKEEPTGKLFPASDRSRDVLNALLSAARDAGVVITPSCRVHDVTCDGSVVRVASDRGLLPAAAAVLATGGLSLPKSGSDGKGFEIASRLGHTLVPTTPALAPLLLGDADVHEQLSGVSHNVELALRVWASAAEAPLREGRIAVRIRGPLLWTHFGISGPAALDMSRHWLRAAIDGQYARVVANLADGSAFEMVDRDWAAATGQRPRATLLNMLSNRMPASVASVILRRLRFDPDARVASLPRDRRRALVHALVAFPLDVTASRGYNHAEATAGGVSLDEIDPTTMQSRRRAGVYLVGEMLDVDGRLGGFNFQWAWSSARTAAEALARLIP